MSEFDLPTSTFLSRLSGTYQEPKPAPASADPLGIREAAAGRQVRASEADQLWQQNSGDATRMATAVLEGNNLANSEILRSFSEDNLVDVERTYGPDAASMATAVRSEMDRIRRGKLVSRTTDQLIGDTARDIGAGIVGGVGGIAGLGAGMINDRAGAEVAEWTDEARTWLSDNRSDWRNEQRDARDVRRQLDREDVASTYSQNVREGDEKAGLKRFGQEVVLAAQDLANDPSATGTLVSEGIGSLVVSAGIGGVASKGVAKLLLKRRGASDEVARAFMASPAGRELVSRINAGTMPAAIGLLEGGGAYSQIQNEIQRMDEFELMESSEDYRRLRAENLSHEEARDEIANSAALQGGAIQGAVGAATGTLVSRLEANPFRAAIGSGAPGNSQLVTSLRSLGSAVLREGSEESLQGISGEMVAGTMVQRYADENRDPMEGVGTAAVEGLVAGVGMAGVMRAPGVPTAALRDGSRIASNAMSEAMARLDAELEAQSGVGGEATTAALSSIQDAVAEARATVLPADPVAEDEITFGESAETVEQENPLQKVADLALITGNELNGVPDGVMSMVNEDGEAIPADFQADRSVIIQTVLGELGETRFSKGQRSQSAVWLAGQMRQMESLRDLDLEAMSAEAPALVEKVQSALEALTALEADPRVVAALDEAKGATMETVMGEAPLPRITAENAASPEVSQAVEKAGLVAVSNPAGIDPKFLGEALDQMDRVNASPKAKAALRSAKAVTDTVAEADVANEALAKEFSEGPSKKAVRKRIDIIRNQILETGRNEHADLKGQMGASQHVAGILQALDQGDTLLAQQRMDVLGNFVQHFTNKVEAARESAAMGRGDNNQVSFATWTGRSMIPASHKNAGKAFVNPNSENGRLFAREVEIDARTMQGLYRKLAASLPEMQAMTFEDIKPVLERASTRNANDRVEETTQSAEQQLRESQEANPTEERIQDTELSEKEAKELGLDEGLASYSGERPTPPERRIRKDAVAKTKDSLIDYEDQIGTEAETATVETSAEQDAESFIGTASAVEINESRLEEGEVRDPQEAGPTDTENRGVSGNRSGTVGVDGAPEAQQAEAVEESVDVSDVISPVDPLEETRAQIGNDVSKGFEGYLGRAFSFDPSRSIAIRAAKPASAVIGLLRQWTKRNDALKEMFPDTKIGMFLDQGHANDLANGFQMLTQDLLQEMRGRLKKPTKIWSDPKNLNRKLTPIEALTAKSRKGVPFHKFQSAFALHLVDPVTKDYLPRFLEAGVLAAVDWALTAETITETDAEKIGKDWGIPTELVDASVMALSMQGFNGTTAKENLARHIEQFWGAQRNTEIPSNMVRGISESLAADLLDVMDGRLITKINGLIPDQSSETGTSERSVVKLGHESTRELVKSMGAGRRFLGRAMLIEPEEPVGIGSKPPRKYRTQKGNLLGVLGSKTDRAIEKHRDTVFYRNPLMLGLMNALGRDAWLELRGWKQIDKAITNVRHLASIEGKNRTLEMSYDRTMEHDKMVALFSAVTEIIPNEVPTYFDFVQARNGRIMMRGHNPQADKAMREAMIATRGTLDLSTVKGSQAFWLTVGQSADVTKPELKRRRVAVKETIEKIRSKYPNTIEMFSHMAGEVFEFGKIDTMSPEEIDAIKTEMGTSLGEVVSDKLLHALMSVGKYDYVLENYGRDSKEFKNFSTDLSLEADGKTNGPFMAMMMFLDSRFSKKQLKMLRKGGFFPNVLGKTLNSQLGPETGDLDGDLYQTSSNLTQEKKDAVAAIMRLTTERKNSDTALPIEQFDRVYRVLTTLGDLEIEGGKLIIGRSVLKNPLTITIYGSGETGIAGKIASAMADVLGQRLSEFAKTMQELEQAEVPMTNDHIRAIFPDYYDGLWKDIVALSTQRITFNRRKGTYNVTKVVKNSPMEKSYQQRLGRELTATDKRLSFSNAPTLRRDVESLKRFELDGRHMSMITENILHSLVGPMTEAIAETTLGVQRVMERVQVATQTQSLVFKARFKSEVDRMIAEKLAVGELKEGDTLSKRDYDAVFKKMAKFGAVIETVEGGVEDLHHINLSDLENSRGNKIYSRSLNSTFGGKGTERTPSLAGVSAMPMLTISRGDAMMMVNYYAGQKVSLRGLQVYDGQEIAADEIDTVSEAMNEAVIETIFQNPLRDAADSFADWIRQNKDGDVLEGLSVETIEKIAEAQGEGRVDNETDEELRTRVLEGVTDLSAELELSSRGAQARRDVLASMGFSMDQMASAESPANYGTEADLIAVPQGDDEALVAEMNWRFEKAQTKIEKDLGRVREELGDAVQETPETGSNEEFAREIRAYARPAEPLQEGETDDGTTGVRKINSVVLMALLDIDSRDPSNTSPEQRNLANALSNRLSAAFGKWNVVMGTQEELESWRDRHYPKPDGSPGRPIQMGQTDLENGILYISNLTRETLLHEMLHAATAATIYAYASNADQLQDVQKNAVENLDALMSQFLDLQFEGEARPVAEAARGLQDEIRQALSKDASGTKGAGWARGIQEFIAWTLTNQNLIQVLKKTRTRSKLATLVDSALKGLRRLLGLPAKASLDLFGNIQWNTAAIVQLEQSGSAFESSATAVLDQADRSNYPQEDGRRVEAIRERFEQRIGRHLRARQWANTELTENEQSDKLYEKAKRALFGFGHVYDWSHSDRKTFQTIVAAMAGSMEMDARSMTQATRLYNHVVKNLSARDFQEDPDAEAGSPDMTRAQERYNLLLGKEAPAAADPGTGIVADNLGRSMIIPAFVALSQIDPQFRAVLAGMEKPKSAQYDSSSLDRRLESLGRKSMDALSDRITSRANRADEALDMIAGALSSIERDTRSEIEKKTLNAMEWVDGKATGVLSEYGDKLVRLGQTISDARRQEETGRIKKETSILISGSMTLVGSLMSKDQGRAMADAAVSYGNESQARKVEDGNWNGFMGGLVPKTAWSIMNEVLGMTDSRRSVLELMNRVKYAVSSVRQEYRERLPEELARQFKTDIKKQGWQDLFEGLAQVDVAALRSVMRVDQILEILRNDGKRKKSINNHKKALQKDAMAPSEFAAWDAAAKDLAVLLATGNVRKGNHRLLRNAEAIWRLASPRNTGQEKSSANVPLSDKERKVVERIDRLVSLYAIEVQAWEKPELSTRLKELYETEGSGVEYSIAYLSDLRSDEMRKASTGEAKLNGWKGYIPAESPEGARIEVADKRSHATMLRRGFVQVAEYDGGSGKGLEKGQRAYYHSSVGSPGTYVQGIMQTVQKTAFGVDVRTGQTLDAGVVRTGGRISDEAFLRIQNDISRGRGNQGQSLLPVFDGSGLIVGYERSMDPEVTKYLDQNRNLADMIGAWKGRQSEEAMAEGFNRKLIDRSYELWKEAKSKNRKDGYVDLSDSDARQEDKAWESSWKMIPRETKQYIRSRFGEDGFMVRRDLIDNTLGYRMMSVGAIWDGTSNLDEKTVKSVKDAAELVFGTGFYRELVRTERFWQAGVSVVKSTIVIRSVIVPAANLVSNVIQLAVRGVPMRMVVKGFRDKLVEIDQFLKHQSRRAELDAKKSYARAKNDLSQLRQLEAEERSLDEADRRMSIWDLVEAGEFSTISEGLTDADAAISQGNLAEYLTNLADRIPAKLGTVGRYAMVTRDTALFQGMSRAVQYGDFLAKAVLYDHLTQQKNKSSNEAMEEITEEFVNYNLLPGRVRNYAESMGLAWFWAYKLRSIKVAHRMMRDNPVRAMLLSLGMPWGPNIPGINVGSPMTDNAASVIADGRAGYSLGLNMLFSGPGLNPWINATN